MSNPKKYVALALGSGGARGLAHIGVIKVLEENKVPINLVTGTSIGALIGGVYASGKDINSLENIVQDVNKVMVAKLLIPKLFSSGFADNKRIIDFIKTLVGNVKIENLKIPFAAVATDFITGEEVIIDKGPLVDAIMASIAIPTIFQPVHLNGLYLIDGGMSNPLPISIAKEMGARKIIAVNVSPNPKRFTKVNRKRRTDEVKILLKKLPAYLSNLRNDGKRQKPIPDSFETIDKDKVLQSYSPTIFNVFMQSISISTNNLIKQQLRNARPDVLITPHIEDYDLLEFYKGPEIIKCGYDEALKSLPDIKSLL